MTDSTNAKLEALLSKLEGAHISGDAYKAKCPAHDDLQASLSICERDGKILLYCHAGCETKDILQALGLPMSALFMDSKPAPKKRGKIVARYPYTDASGKLLYEVCRFEPKDFRQCRPDGQGGLVWNLTGIQRVLYRLPAITQAIAEGMTIFIVEGEKDVHSLESIGLVATSNAGGAGKWLESYSDALKGGKVVILPDNDEPGKKHAEQVARSLQGKAESVRIVNLPNLPAKGDVSDWVKAGGTAEELTRLVDQVPEWTDQAEDRSDPREHHTDLGNAKRLVARFGDILRYCFLEKGWRVWNGTLWTRDESGEVSRLAKKTVMGIYTEALAENLSREQRADGRDCHDGTMWKSGENACGNAAQRGITTS